MTSDYLETTNEYSIEYSIISLAFRQKEKSFLNNLSTLIFSLSCFETHDHLEIHEVYSVMVGDDLPAWASADCVCMYRPLKWYRHLAPGGWTRASHVKRVGRRMYVGICSSSY